MSAVKIVPPPEERRDPAARKPFRYRETAIGILSAAAFAGIFYLWGEELLPRAAGRSGGLFPFVGAVALTLAVALFLTEWFGFAGREVRKVRLAARDFLLLFSLVLFLFFLAKAVMDVLPDIRALNRLVPARCYVYLIPVTAFAMIVRMLLNSEVAILFTVAASVLAAGAASGRWPTLLFLLLCGTAGAARAGRIPDRYRALLAGVLAAPVCAMGAAALEYAFHGPSYVLWAGVFGALNGIASGPIAIAILPVAESVFGYASDIRLVELAGTGHPLLRKLMIEAPGTFHHSVLVGTLAEAGAAAIGANPNLCRTAALFHDVGKIVKPGYFSENQAGMGNVHDFMSPAASRQVIVSHVSEGVRLAEDYRLGERVVEIIRQHHGTSVLYCFYDKAQRGALNGEAIEETFRYPGPSPKTREAAIIMLADAAEAAVRSLSAPTPAEIAETVQRLANRIHMDGQLNDCDMTLRDFHAVGLIFTKVLTAMTHTRIDYPASGKGFLRPAN
jgi:putative nucleotidyltransferase with HDIG domain